jgi:hypothetical protein
MNTERDAAFEAWWDEFARNYFVQIGYDIEADEHVCRIAVAAWQAATERAAKIAEQSAYVVGVDLSSGYTMACGVIADKIRAEGGA